MAQYQEGIVLSVFQAEWADGIEGLWAVDLPANIRKGRPVKRIPQELKDLNQWHCWEDRDGVKVPVQINGAPAKSNDPKTWSDFSTAGMASDVFSGLAFEITEPYCGVDLDNCLDENGKLKPWAMEIVARFSGVAYMEFSPSGTGIKLITRARKPEGARCVHKFDGEKEQVECYDNRRFWAMTGKLYAGEDELDNGQKAVDWLCQEYLTPDIGIPISGPQEVRHVDSDLEQRATDYIQNAGPAGQGDRNNCAFRLAGNLMAMRDDHGGELRFDQILDFMRDWNAGNSPPLPDHELQHVTTSASRNGTPREVKRPEVIITSDDIEVDLSHLLAKLNGEEPPVEEIPADLMQIPGLIGDIVDHNLNTAFYPLPELAFAGALSLMSVITGGKVQGMRHRSNLLVMGLAPSGAGKDHARQLNRSILHRANHPTVAGPERIGSSAGMVSTMVASWRSLFQIDEIGSLLATMNDTRNPYLYKIADFLLQVYGSANSVWRGEAYADQKKVPILAYPHCVVYGTSVPDGFWEGLTQKSLTGGLVARFLIFEQPDYVDHQIPSDEEIPESIIQRSQAWLEFAPNEGNLGGVDGAHPKTITATKEASDRLYSHASEISSKRKGEETAQAALWSRAGEKAQKLALLFACSRWAPGEEWPEITAEDADRAVKLANFLTRRTLKRAGLHVAGSLFERDLLKMLRIIRSKPEWTASELARAFRAPSRHRRELIDTLVEAEQVERYSHDTGGRPVVKIRASIV